LRGDILTLIGQLDISFYTHQLENLKFYFKVGVVDESYNTL